MHQSRVAQAVSLRHGLTAGAADHVVQAGSLRYKNAYQAARSVAQATGRVPILSGWAAGFSAWPHTAWLTGLTVNSAITCS